MSLKDLQAELLQDHKDQYEALVQIAYLSEKHKWKDIFDLTIKKAASHKLMIDYLEKEIQP